ncbi:protein kinase domain-containing protein [Nocardiopsis suaedae]|uniref:Protein kinase n=1 Tax=Nocardiopsis suaedae TaxID=3018444 RepID=A0ABT4TKA2_9ACTN|nr:protein kinase [Nocardiopsis suaedae]MDA2805118.1 protein kinase [Nocardiopsis suaedae]
MGPYQLRARLGAGGMGQVFLGRSKGGRPVAVKLVREELAGDAGFRRRFALEVDAARRVGGHITAQVVDADTDGARPWLATAYIAGPSLQWAVDEHGPLPPRSVADLGAGLAEGLAAVHAEGLVHRDLKPGNVILAEDGPRVIDFGIARAMDTTSFTQSRTLLGTPAFMSPEQARGEEIGPPSDVFSLGCVLAFAASGDGPFGSGVPHAVTYRIVHEAPDLSGISRRLAKLVKSCLEKEPGRRPSTDDVLDDLAPQAEEAPPGAHWVPDAVTEVITREKTRVLTLVGPEEAKAASTGPERAKEAARRAGDPKTEARVEPRKPQSSEPLTRRRHSAPKAVGKTNVNWTFTAVNFRGRNHERFTVVFPPGGSVEDGRVWGTSVYSDDSSVGLAAVHAGLITLKHGGKVTFEVGPGQVSYAGSIRNGVASAKGGRSRGSFVFPPKPQEHAPLRRWAASPRSPRTAGTPDTATGDGATGAGTSTSGTSSSSQDETAVLGWAAAGIAAVGVALLYLNHTEFAVWASQWANGGTAEIVAGDCITYIGDDEPVEIPCFSAAAAYTVAEVRPVSADGDAFSLDGPTILESSESGLEPGVMRHVCDDVPAWTRESPSFDLSTGDIACLVPNTDSD